jgi:hypothetical protein
MAEWRRSREKYRAQWLAEKAEHGAFMAKHGGVACSVNPGYDRDPFEAAP